MTTLAEVEQALWETLNDCPEAFPNLPKKIRRQILKEDREFFHLMFIFATNRLLPRPKEDL